MNITINGADDVYKALGAISKSLPERTIYSANRAASKVLVEREKLLAPEGPTGNLVDSIGAIKPSKKSGREVGSVVVGPRRKNGYKGFAGHFVEYGTKQRRNKRGANRGVMPNEPFAEPAFNQTKVQIEGSIKTELQKAVVRAMKRYA